MTLDSVFAESIAAHRNPLVMAERIERVLAGGSLANADMAVIKGMWADMCGAVNAEDAADVLALWADRYCSVEVVG